MSGAQASPCSQCGLKDLCISRNLSPSDERALGRVIRQTRAFAHGRTLFWQGDQFEALYAVRSGAVKSVSCDAEGQERVRGFFLPGDIIGLDALHSGSHPASAETLGEARFCVLPHSAVDQLLDDIPGFSRRMLGLMSLELSRSLSLAGDYSAEQRMVAFLLDIADRLGHRTGRYSQIRLEMSRADIANFLRLVTETVSRVLSRFAQKSWIQVRRREISILDRAALEQLAAPLREGQLQREPAEFIRTAA